MREDLNDLGPARFVNRAIVTEQYEPLKETLKQTNPWSRDDVLHVSIMIAQVRALRQLADEMEADLRENYHR